MSNTTSDVRTVKQYRITQQPETLYYVEKPSETNSTEANSTLKPLHRDHHSSKAWNGTSSCSNLDQCCCCMCIFFGCRSDSDGCNCCDGCDGCDGCDCDGCDCGGCDCGGCDCGGCDCGGCNC